MKKLVVSSLLCVVFATARADELDCEPFERCLIPYLRADFLYWKAHEDDIPFASRGFDTDTLGDVYEVDWQWRPGFRLGVGALFGSNGWGASLTYTWYRNRSKGSASAPEDLLGIWSSFTPADNVFASADWVLRYNTLDLALGKCFSIGDCFTLRPTIALRGAYIKDSYFIRYISEFAAIPDDVHNFQKVGSIGPQVGFNVGYSFASCWSLILESAFSLLWSNYEIRRFDTGPFSPHHNIRHKTNGVRAAAEIRLGLGYDQMLFGCCTNWLVAWEHQIWFEHSQLLYGDINFNRLIWNRNSNLNLYGLTLRGEVSF